MDADQVRRQHLRLQRRDAERDQHARWRRCEPNRDRGYEINQVNTSGTVDVTPDATASFLSVRGGYFHDRYTDTGIPQTTNYRYGRRRRPSTPASRRRCRGRADFENTPRAQITDFDTTKRSNFNVDYNHYFNAARQPHAARAGYGFQHVVNDINSFYPGGYVDLLFGSSFTFGGVTTGTGTYGYYEVNDRRITNQAGSDIQSLYVQDQWTLGNRLTLNLGHPHRGREHPELPAGGQRRPAIKFSMKDKLAPRLGAAYDVWGDGRMKVFGSWGLYYDWTKYELPRGSFGAETWCTYYRGLDTLDFGSLNLSNMPGRDLWVTPGTCRDRRVPVVRRDRSRHQADAAVEHQRRRRVSARAQQRADRPLHPQRSARDDRGHRLPERRRATKATSSATRASGLSALQYPTGAHAGRASPTPRPKRQYDALELGYNRRFANNWFFSANYTLSRLYGNYAGLASSDEITTPTTGGSSATAQQQAGSIARPGGNTNRAWDLDELLWDSHGNLGVLGRLATDRPHVVKLYGAYDFPFGTQVGAFFYGGSGTPVYTYVTSTNSADLFVEGRNGWYENGQVTDGKRTPKLYRTDLLLSHELALRGTEAPALRAERAERLQPADGAAHLQLPEQGRDHPRSPVVVHRSARRRPVAGLRLHRADQRDDRRRGQRLRSALRQADLFEPGRRAYATVKFLFDPGIPRVDMNSVSGQRSARSLIADS